MSNTSICSLRAQPVRQAWTPGWPVRSRLSRLVLFGAMLLSLSFAAPAGLAAQLRNSVAIIHPRIISGAKKACLDMARDLRAKGFDKAADNMVGQASSGSFGSGFLVKDGNDRTIMVTNRHVVTFADEVDVDFTLDDGSSRSIKGCPVVYKDADLDFAAVLLPIDQIDGLPVLSLATSLPAEGSDVWSAGYPGLGVKPAWQLARGNISNRRFVDPELGLPEEAIFIQHSAPISPGNSGGPLLVGDPTQPDGLKVIGINTLKAWARENTNFAITLDQVRKAIARVPAGEDTPDQAEAAVREQAAQLAEALNQDKPSRFLGQRFVSYQLMIQQGWACFNNGLAKLAPTDADNWRNYFYDSMSIEVLRQFILHRMQDTLQKPGVAISVTGISALPAGDGGILRFRSVLAAGTREYRLDWAREYGRWLLVGADLPAAGLTLTGKPAVPAKSSGVTPRTRQPGEPDPREAPQDTPADAEPAPPPETAGEDLDPKPLGLPFGMLISGGATLLPSLGGWTPGYNGAIGYQFAIASFFTMGFTFGVDQDTSLIVEGEQTTRTLAEAGIYARLGLPLMADTWGVVPYLGAGIKGASPVAGGSNKGFVRFDATLGAMFTWSKWGAVGVELSPCFSLDARPVRLDGVPMRLFVIL